MCCGRDEHVVTIVLFLEQMQIVKYNEVFGKFKNKKKNVAGKTQKCSTRHRNLPVPNLLKLDSQVLYGYTKFEVSQKCLTRFGKSFIL